MNQYISGELIKKLRERDKMTQAVLAQRLNVSDKTVSKWETGRGYPDISLLQPLAEVFKVSVAELLSGDIVINNNVGANMFRSDFYVCPVCGNVIHSMGQAVVSCHGINLIPAAAEDTDESHSVSIENIEDEYFVSVAHEMSKEHYISFISAVSNDRIQFVKLYPEGNAEARFKKSGVRFIYCYCNRDGLFRIKV